MRGTNPLELARNSQKSRLYFLQQGRWRGKRKCPRCNYRYINHLSSYEKRERERRYSCKRCRYVFSDFTRTYLARLKISFDIISHLLYLFVLGVPAYRIRWYVSINLATIERTFRIFRQAIIYDSLILEIQNLKLSGEIEIDEALFGGHHIKEGSVDGVLLSTKI